MGWSKSNGWPCIRVSNNAQLPIGPTSETGKAKSSLDGVKTGLTGRTVLLPSDDAALYEAHVAEFIKRLASVGEDEQNLVQSLADTEWRLMRIPVLEMSIYALGRIEFAELFAKDETVREHLIEAKIFPQLRAPRSRRVYRDIYSIRKEHTCQANQLPNAKRASTL